MQNEPIEELSELLQNTARQPRKQRKAYVFIASIVFVIAISPFIAQYIANKLLDYRIKDAAILLPPECSFSYDETSYELWKRKYFIDNMQVSCNGVNVVSIDRMELGSVVNGRPIPSNMIIKMTGGKTDVTSMPYGILGELLSQVGYGELEFESYISYNLGVVSKDLRIFSFNVKTEGLGELSVELHVPTVDAATLEGLLVQAGDNSPIKLWVGFKDRGFADSVLDYYAAKYGVNSADAKDMLLANMEKLIEKEDKYITAQKNKLIQMYRFIDTPREVTFTTQVGSDLSLTDMFQMIEFDSESELLTVISEMPIDITTR